MHLTKRESDGIGLTFIIFPRAVFFTFSITTCHLSDVWEVAFAFFRRGQICKENGEVD